MRTSSSAFWEKPHYGALIIFKCYTILDTHAPLALKARGRECQTNLSLLLHAAEFLFTFKSTIHMFARCIGFDCKIGMPRVLSRPLYSVMSFQKRHCPNGGKYISLSCTRQITIYVVWCFSRILPKSASLLCHILRSRTSQMQVYLFTWACIRRM